MKSGHGFTGAVVFKIGSTSFLKKKKKSEHELKNRTWRKTFKSLK